jgi:hypothetical protein
MKKVVVMLLVVMCFALTFAQEKPRVVIFASGETPHESDLKAFYTQMETRLQNSGKYRIWNQSPALNKRIAEIINYQQSSRAVNDDQLIKLGKELGVEFVIHVECSKNRDVFTMQMKSVDMTTNEVVGNAGLVNSDLKNAREVQRCAIELANQFLKGGMMATGYGSGIFLSKDSKTDHLSEVFADIITGVISFRQGECGDGGVEVQIKVVDRGRVDGKHRLDITVKGTDCGTWDDIQTIRGYIEGSSQGDVERKLSNQEIKLISPTGSSFEDVVYSKLRAWSRGGR